ncbi:MAG TPA: hypothetical protein VMR75_02780 [Candidatus Saccharimonadales bacterium]|nr:hypothetical protein [Candidatus Saccharimonadales bacterium]
MLTFHPGKKPAKLAAVPLKLVARDPRVMAAVAEGRLVLDTNVQRFCRGLPQEATTTATIVVHEDIMVLGVSVVWRIRPAGKKPYRQCVFPSREAALKVFHAFTVKGVPGELNDRLIEPGQHRAVVAKELEFWAEEVLEPVAC